MAAPRTEAERQRALRRRHKHERQAVVFGSLVAALAVAGLGSAAVYTDALDVPFLDAGFSTPPPEEAAAAQPDPPCPPEGTLPVPYSSVQVTVLNASGRTGLAGQTATELGTRGFAVLGVGDFPVDLPTPVRVAFGQAGLASAYTLAASFDDAVLALDTRADASVDLVLGEGFSTLLDPATIVIDPAAPLVGVDGCVPLDLALSQAQPAPVATEPAATEPAAP